MLGLLDLSGLDALGAGKDTEDSAIDIGSDVLEIRQDDAVVSAGDFAPGAAFSLVLALAGHYLAGNSFFTAVITYFTHN